MKRWSDCWIKFKRFLWLLRTFSSHNIFFPSCCFATTQKFSVEVLKIIFFFATILSLLSTYLTYIRIWIYYGWIFLLFQFSNSLLYPRHSKSKKNKPQKNSFFIISILLTHCIVIMLEGTWKEVRIKNKLWRIQ